MGGGVGFSVHVFFFISFFTFVAQETHHGKKSQYVHTQKKSQYMHMHTSIQNIQTGKKNTYPADSLAFVHSGHERFVWWRGGRDVYRKKSGKNIRTQQIL